MKSHRALLFFLLSIVIASAVSTIVVISVIRSTSIYDVNSNPQTDNFGNEEIRNNIEVNLFSVPESPNTQTKAMVHSQACTNASLLLEEHWNKPMSWHPPWFRYWYCSLNQQDDYNGSHQSGSVQIYPPRYREGRLGAMVNVTFTNQTELEASFWVKVEFPLQISTHEAFVWYLHFTDGTELGYLIDGYYSPIISHERIVDVRDQLTAYNTWTKINITNIANDYRAQFNTTTIPNVDYVEFYVWYTRNNRPKIRVDEIYLYKCVVAEKFWHRGDYVKINSIYAFIRWNVTVSSIINTTDVWIIFYLQYAISNISATNTSTLKLNFTLLQKALIHIPFIGNKSVGNNWTSKALLLPRDGYVYGSHLRYNFTVTAAVYGAVLNSSAYVYVEKTKENINVIDVWWTTVGGTNYVPVVAIPIVGTIAGMGIISKRRKKKVSDISSLT